MYRNEIQLYYFIENIVKEGNYGLIKNTPTSISNINKALINSATLTSSASNIHKNDGPPMLSWPLPLRQMMCCTRWTQKLICLPSTNIS